MPKKASKPPYGQQLERRRKELRKTLDVIEAETGGLLYRQKITRIETGRKRPDSLTVDETIELAKSLEWSVDKLNAVLGVRRKIDTHEHQVELEVYKSIKEGITQPDMSISTRHFDRRELPPDVAASKLFVAEVLPTDLIAGNLPYRLKAGDVLVLERRPYHRTHAGEVVVGVIDELDRGFIVVNTQPHVNAPLREAGSGNMISWTADLELQPCCVVRRLIINLDGRQLS